MRNPERNIYVLCRKVGYIPFLGICGPVANPLQLPAKLCLDIITSGIKLYEFEPSTHDTLELTSDNIFEDDNFGVKSKVTEVIPKPNNAPIKNFGVSSSDLNDKVEEKKPLDKEPPVTEEKSVDEKVVEKPPVTDEKVGVEVKSSTPIQPTYKSNVHPTRKK